MCEILGITSTAPQLINPYIEEFITRSDAHPNGWGMALMEHNHVNYEKEPVQASKSAYLKARLSVPIPAQNAFFHIRYATVGNIEYRNCHPFVKEDAKGRPWTLIHNGTIFDYEPLHPYAKLQEGDTDSERILLYLVHELNHFEEDAGHKLDAEERFHFVEGLVADLAKNNKLNLLIYDGEQMYVHTNYKNSLYYCHHLSPEENSTVFCTQPLSGGTWKPVPFTTLLAYKDGKRVFTGEPHNNEYVDSEENMKYLYSIFANI